MPDLCNRLAGVFPSRRRSQAVVVIWVAARHRRMAGEPEESMARCRLDLLKRPLTPCSTLTVLCLLSCPPYILQFNPKAFGPFEFSNRDYVKQPLTQWALSFRDDLYLPPSVVLNTKRADCVCNQLGFVSCMIYSLCYKLIPCNMNSSLWKCNYKHITMTFACCSLLINVHATVRHVA